MSATCSVAIHVAVDRDLVDPRKPTDESPKDSLFHTDSADLDCDAVIKLQCTVHRLFCPSRENGVTEQILHYSTQDRVALLRASE